MADVNDGSGEHQPLESVMQAAKVAAASAAVGAAAAAARALTHQNDDGADEEQLVADEEEPRNEPEEATATAGDDETPSEPEELPADEAEVDEAEPTAQETRGAEKDEEPVGGAALGDAKQTVARAREQLEALLGRSVESVSSLERTHDGWVVALEVLEFSRIPESTDVLASYEMELDNDLNLRRYQQVRRYHRAEAERGEDS
jgi:Gas vesicle synthesis protein GvpO